MKRRTVLSGALGAAGAALAAPALAQGIRELTMVTSWPRGFPGLHDGAQSFANRVTSASGGKLKVEVAAAGELVEALEVFEAVSAGVADIYHSVDYYRVKESLGFGYFGAVPFGMTANEMTAWIAWGDGQALWDELSGHTGIKPLMAGSTGVQMGGWFTREVTSIESYKGLKYRMPGLGGEVLTALGATVVGVAGGKINDALRTGAVDAAEWIGPWADVALGLHESAKYYYYPGFHEPGTTLTTGFNREVWDSLSAEHQSLVASAAAAENSSLLALFNARNAAALLEIVATKKVELRRFDDETLRKLHSVSKELLADRSSVDPLTSRIHSSYMAFSDSARGWTEIADHAYLNARSL